MLKHLVLALCVLLVAGCGERDRASRPTDSGSAPAAGGEEGVEESGEAIAPEPVVIHTEMVMEELEESTEDQDTLPQADMKSLPALEKWLAHSEYEKRVAAAAQLGVLGGRALDAAGALKEALQDDAGAVRVAAALALWQVTGRSDATVAALQEVLVRGRGALRIEAAWALGSMAKQAEPAIGQLVRVLAGAVGPSGERMDYSDGAMVVEPGYINTSERSAAAEALGQIGVKRAEVLAALRGLAKNGTTCEREAATEALEALDDG